MAYLSTRKMTKLERLEYIIHHKWIWHSVLDVRYMGKDFQIKLQRCK